MAPDKLLEWLKTLGIDIASDLHQPDGKRVITFTAQLPFPSTRRVWYSLVLTKDQKNVADKEIEALLRHCWHAEQEIPKFPVATKSAAAPGKNGPTKASVNTVRRVKP